MAEMYVVIDLNCDARDIPHWRLYTIDDDNDERIFEALGITGQDFNFNTESVDLGEPESGTRRVCIGRIEADIWPEVPSILENLPLSKEAGWNCQNWVMQAITALTSNGYLELQSDGLADLQKRYQKTAGEY